MADDGDDDDDDIDKEYAISDSKCNVNANTPFVPSTIANRVATVVKRPEKHFFIEYKHLNTDINPLRPYIDVITVNSLMPYPSSK